MQGCPPSTLYYAPAVCAYYNTIFFRPSIILCTWKSCLSIFFLFFLVFSFLFSFFFFVFPAFSLHFYSQTNFLTSNWQKLTSSRAMDRQMYGEHTREREGETQLTDCLIDRSQCRQSQSRVSQTASRTVCERWFQLWKGQHTQTRPFSHAVSRSAARSPSSPSSPSSPVHVCVCVVCRAELLLSTRRCCLTFQWYFQLERKEKCGLRTKTQLNQQVYGRGSRGPQYWQIKFRLMCV